MEFAQIEITKFGEQTPVEVLSNYPYAVGTEGTLLVQEGEYKFGTHRDCVINKCSFFLLKDKDIQFTGEYLGSQVIVTLYSLQTKN